LADTFIPTTITIDGVEVPIRIARFDFESKNAFARDYAKVEGIQQRTAALERLALSKASLPTKPEPMEDLEKEAPEETEEAKAERLARNTERMVRNTERLKAHAANVTLALALRELDDTPTQRAQREALEVENDRFAARFVKDTFERFITIDPAYELIDADGRRVQSGLDLLRSYPTYSQMFYLVLYKVLNQNALALDLKKKLASPSASATSSDAKSEPSLTAAGDPPAPTAASASSAIYAAPVAATE
jgi:hypothetical protein